LIQISQLVANWVQPVPFVNNYSFGHGLVVLSIFLRMYLVRPNSLVAPIPCLSPILISFV
jgi:hypothetical protein